MSVIITDQASDIKFLFDDGTEKYLDKSNLNIKKDNGIFTSWVYFTNGSSFVNTADNEVIRLKSSEVTSPVYADNDALIAGILGFKASTGQTVGDVRITDGTTVLNIEPNGSMPVTLQDQTTPTVIVKATNLEQQTTLSAPAVYDASTLTVTSPTGISAGKILTLFDAISLRFSQFEVVGIAGSVVTVDSLIDFAFPAGTYVDVGESNMAVNGSVTPVRFGIRNNFGSPPAQVDLTMDVTRLIFKCTGGSAMDLTTFGDLTKLTNGLLCRKRDGETYNIFNVKNNGEFTGIMYDFQIVAATSPQAGIDGFYGRLTFAGQNKLGVTVRLPIDEDLEFYVQDNLSGLTLLEVVAEGSLVLD